MKSDCRQPSEFKIIAKKCCAEEMETENKKKQKTQHPTIKEEVKTRIQPSRKTPLKKEDPKEKKKVKISVPDDQKDESVQKKNTRPVQSRKPSTKNSARPKSLPESPHSLSYYSHHLPIFIIEHIEKLFNPNLEGHCGFRAVSSILHQDQDQWPKIREEVANQISSKEEHYEDNLLVLNVKAALKCIKFEVPEDEEDQSCRAENWMSLPSTSYALADLYQRPFFFFSKSWSETMLPSFSPPNNKPPFFIALLGNHIMFLELKNPSLFPAPQLAAEWTRYASQEALAWKDKYDDCFKLTQQLKKNTRSNRMVY
jgi:hypothetical protein